MKLLLFICLKLLYFDCFMHPYKIISHLQFTFHAYSDLWSWMLENDQKITIMNTSSQNGNSLKFPFWLLCMLLSSWAIAFLHWEFITLVLWKCDKNVCNKEITQQIFQAKSFSREPTDRPRTGWLISIIFHGNSVRTCNDSSIR